jgi:hypothetical protein
MMAHCQPLRVARRVLASQLGETWRRDLDPLSGRASVRKLDKGKRDPDLGELRQIPGRLHAVLSMRRAATLGYRPAGQYVGWQHRCRLSSRIAEFQECEKKNYWLQVSKRRERGR